MDATQTQTQTASDILMDQHVTIQRAIDLLQSKLDRMTDTVNPETSDWSDIARFADAADAAKCVIERYEE
jgi:hemerythrin-like domain-containing protein